MTIDQEIEVFETPTSSACFDENGILCTVYKKNAVLSKEGLEKSFEIIKSRAKGEKICWLGEVSNLTASDKEARDFAAIETPKFVKALALIVNSPLSRMVANLYLMLKKPAYPTRLFTDHEKAREWLKQYL